MIKKLFISYMLGFLLGLAVLGMSGCTPESESPRRVILGYGECFYQDGHYFSYVGNERVR